MKNSYQELPYVYIVQLSIVWIIILPVVYFFPKMSILDICSFRGTTIIFMENLQSSILSTLLHIFLPLKFAAIHFCYYIFLSAYFRTPVTLKQTSYRSSFIFRAVSIVLKWEQPLLWSLYFFAKITFSEYQALWNSYFFLMTTFWQQIRLLISYFLKINTFSAHSYFFGGSTVSE